MAKHPPLFADTAASAAERARFVAALRAADLGHPLEVLLRYLIVISAGVALYYATRAPLMLIWVLAYLVPNSVYCAVLWATRPPVSRRRTAFCIASNAVVSTIYAALPLYLWTWDDTAIRAIGLCGVAGHAVFNMSRHTERGPITYWDSLSILCFIAFMGGYQMVMRTDGMAQQVVIGIGTLAVIIYYITAQWTVIHAREAAAEALQKAAQDNKIKAIGQLTSGISHDFNNLLTVIGGNIELAQLSDNPKERRELLDQARIATDRAAQLTSQLLTFSRKARLQSVRVEVVPFSESLRDTLDRVLPETILTSIEIDPNAIALHCDPTLLHAALLNLAINARDAMDGRGRLAVFFTSQTDAEGPPLMRITVSDTGPGIPSEIIEKVTEPFFTTKDVGKGSGLGLSMVSGFAAQSGGTLEIDSGNGGTAVSLLLPIRAQDTAGIANRPGP